MSVVDDIINIETDEMSTRTEDAARMQRIVNDGQGWSMQGSMGRSMMAAIEAGEVMLGKKAARDYWGNYIPSRDEVKAGSKGSRAYVVEHNGEEWAAMLEAAEASGDAPADDTQ